MKINLNQQEYSKVAEILNAKEQNISAADIYIEYLTEHYNDIKSAKDSDEFYKKFLKCLNISENDKEYLEINKVCNVAKIEKLDPIKYQNDEYYKVIKNINAKEDGCQFLTLKYEPFEGFVYNELVIDENTFNEHTPIGYFEKEFVYPAVIQNETIWMSIIPHEIETMKEPIKNAKGHVLVLGLGLGYYLFHILLKREVKSVDVVELDKRIINLFNKHLINKFPHLEKLNIIHADGIEYLKKTNKKYDYIFSDIWHNVGDGEILYLKIKSFENKFNNTKFDYWIERSILAMLRRQVLTVFSEQLEGYKESDYLKARNENDEIINRLYFYLKTTEINSFDGLHDLLTEQSLQEIAKHLF